MTFLKEIVNATEAFTDEYYFLKTHEMLINADGELSWKISRKFF